MTLSIIELIVTIRIKAIQHKDTHSTRALSVITLSVIMVTFMLSVVMLSIVMLNAVTLRLVVQSFS